MDIPLASDAGGERSGDTHALLERLLMWWQTVPTVRPAHRQTVSAGRRACAQPCGIPPDGVWYGGTPPYLAWLSSRSGGAEMPTASLRRAVKSWSLCFDSNDSMKRAPLKSAESATEMRSSGTPEPAAAHAEVTSAAASGGKSGLRSRARPEVVVPVAAKRASFQAGADIL